MLQKHIRRSLLALILGLQVIFAFGQYSDEYKTYKSIYPDAKLVRLNQTRDIVIKLNKGNISVSQDISEEDIYLDAGATNSSSKRSLRFSAFLELENVEAATLSYENGKYKELRVEEFKEKADLDDFFYDDSKSLNFIYPNLREGSKSKLAYSENIKNPRFIGPIYFGNFSPIINNKVTITTDKDVHLEFKEFHTEDLDITFNKQVKNKSIVYSWEVKNVDEYKYERHVSTYKKILPHIIPIIASYESDGETVNLGSDVSGLYEWYHSLVKDVNKDDPDPELVTLVDELTADKSSDLDKVKAIYYWTQQNIKYIAFEYALGGFIPREANDVFNKKYGDCKDNSSILYQMLKIAGLEGNLTWIGTRSIPYSYSEVPTPLADNHMILSYTDKDNTYFLDATGRYIPLEFPTSFIQGKEALISNGNSGFEVKHVPVIPARQSALVEQTVLTIEGEDIAGSAETALSGYQKIECFNALESKSKPDDKLDFYNVYLRKGTNKFLVDSYEEDNLFDYDNDFKLTYEFSIKDYVKTYGDEIYINLNLQKDFLDYKTEDDREYDIDYEFKHYNEYTTTLNIPEGYTVEYLPEDLSLSTDYLNFEIKYSSEGNQVIYHHALEIDFLNLDSPKQKRVNELIKKANKAYKEIVVLKKL